MDNTLAESTRWPRLPLNIAFIVATCSLVLVFAAAGTPVPLFNLYRAEDGITNADLGFVSVGYFVGAATSLLIFGRLSNHLGRRPVALVALALAAASCLLLMSVHKASVLLSACLLQGLACGLASTALGAYVIDSAPKEPRWLPAAITGSAPMVGIPLGALGLWDAGTLCAGAPRAYVRHHEFVAGDVQRTHCAQS
jgi:MFS family permease